MSPIRIVLLVSMLAAGTTPLFAQHESPAELEVGRQQYATNCLRCHGPDGDEIANADIGHGKFKRASTDDALIGLIRNGIPNTTMPGVNNISDPNAKAIVAYLRSMAASAAVISALPAGNGSRGKTVFQTKGGCTSCHRIGDLGSRAGPDLSQIGGQRRMVELHRSLIEPDAEVIPANRFIRVAPREGAPVTGRLLNQDTFTLQLLDAKDDKLKSFSKANLREIVFVDKSPMPSFKDKLSTQELSDVISYLGSLKGQGQ